MIAIERATHPHSVVHRPHRNETIVPKSPWAEPMGENENHTVMYNGSVVCLQSGMTSGHVLGPFSTLRTRISVTKLIECEIL